MTSSHRTLKGVIAAIATPVGRDGNPDFGAFRPLAGHLLTHGCDGLNVLGTTGEATSFSLEQRRQLMKLVGASDLPKARLMVGTGAAAVSDAAVLTREAAENGFAGALVLPPFYYKNVPEDGILRYFDAIAEATSSTPIPLYLYNFPALSGVLYSLDLVARLIQRFGSRIAGLKDSSGDLAYARRIAQLSPDLDVFPSNEATLAETRAGGFAGCISATANINSAYCARSLHHADDEAHATAVRIRKLFDGMHLVPAVKALLAGIHGEPGLAAALPPFVTLAAGEALALHERYKQAVAG